MWAYAALVDSPDVKSAVGGGDGTDCDGEVARAFRRGCRPGSWHGCARRWRSRRRMGAPARSSCSGRACGGSDDREALRWLEAASDKGGSEAMVLAGLMFSNGAGLPQPDMKRAAERFPRGGERKEREWSSISWRNAIATGWACSAIRRGRRNWRRVAVEERRRAGDDVAGSPLSRRARVCRRIR